MWLKHARYAYLQTSYVTHNSSDEATLLGAIAQAAPTLAGDFIDGKLHVPSLNKLKIETNGCLTSHLNLQILIYEPAGLPESVYSSQATAFMQALNYACINSSYGNLTANKAVATTVFRDLYRSALVGNGAHYVAMSLAKITLNA